MPSYKIEVKENEYQKLLDIQYFRRKKSLKPDTLVGIIQELLSQSIHLELFKDDRKVLENINEDDFSMSELIQALENKMDDMNSEIKTLKKKLNASQKEKQE